jgi:hypothetical protein
MNAEGKLAAALWEADRHLRTLQEALADWDADAGSVTGWEALDADRLKVRLVDQLLFRFTKLQDTLGERLIPATLSLLQEPFEAWPMRDRLNRLEKLGVLDVDQWLAWRDIRNRLAHEYPDQPDIRFAALLAAIDAARNLAQRYRH